MFTLLGLKYAALAFTGVVGVIQLAAAHNKLPGLLFLRRTLFAYILAIILIVVPLVFFFIWDYIFSVGKIQGSEQAGLFFFSAAAAIIFTLIVSSIVNYKFYSPRASQLNGLDALREGSFFRTFWGRIFGKH